MVDAITYAVGEAIAYAAGRLLGRTFQLEPRHAQRIGELVVVACLAGVLLVLALAYS